ncbi:DUF3892 domain-containing protein [Rhizobium sp. Rhizsp82]|uniref:DUF3892 domain-containing protein n=1 Tax=Rhizobium sp. Rhizsp82 TaxID=3243057 RepID=UPI0039B45941
MPTDHQITCIIPDENDADRRIDSVGGATGSESGGAWCIKLDVAIAGIEDGRWRFWTNGNGKSVWVVIATRNGRKYLKTEADGAEPNNLLSLASCR